MGAVISADKEAIAGDDEDKKAQANDALNVLESMAETQLDKFYTDIEYC